MAKIIIQGAEYELATTLRVAYKIQGQHNHKPYSQIFGELGDMGIERQIEIIYVALTVANPNATLTKQDVLDYCLDHYNLKTIMDIIKEIIHGITGIDPDAEKPAGTIATTESGN